MLSKCCPVALSPGELIQVGKNCSFYRQEREPVIYTELKQDGSLALFFNPLQEQQGGNYTCEATYANDKKVSKTVKIQPISECVYDFLVFRAFFRYWKLYTYTVLCSFAT